MRCSIGVQSHEKLHEDVDVIDRVYQLAQQSIRLRRFGKESDTIDEWQTVEGV